MHHVPGISGKTGIALAAVNAIMRNIPTITVLESLVAGRLGQPFFARQTRVRDPGRRGYTKQHAEARGGPWRERIEHVPEIISAQPHDGTFQLLRCRVGLLPGSSRQERMRLWSAPGKRVPASKRGGQSH